MKPGLLLRWMVRLLACIGAIVSAAYAVHLYQYWSNPVSPVINYPLVQLTNGRGFVQHELRQGESKPIRYGEYTVVIPSTGATFVLFKNNRGRCNIRSANNVLLVETDDNSSLQPFSL